MISEIDLADFLNWVISRVTWIKSIYFKLAKLAKMKTQQ